MSSASANRWQFSLQTLLIAMAFSAVVFAAMSAPGALGGLATFAIAVTVPGLFISSAISGDKNVKAFCISGLVPLFFGIYVIAWAYGWNLFSASSPADLLEWFDKKSSVIKAISLVSWTGAILCGSIALAFRKMVFRSPAAPQ